MTIYRANVFFFSCVLFTNTQAMNETLDTHMARASSPLAEICEQAAFFEALKEMPREYKGMSQELPLSTKTYHELFYELGQTAGPVDPCAETLDPLEAIKHFSGIPQKKSPHPNSDPSELSLDIWLMDLDAAKTLFDAINSSIREDKIPAQAIRYLAIRLGSMQKTGCLLPHLPTIESMALCTKILDLASYFEFRTNTTEKELAIFIRKQLRL